MKVIWVSSYLPRSCGIAYYSEHYISALKKYAKSKNKKINFKILSHTDAKLADFPIIDNVNDLNWHKKTFDKIKKESPDLVHFQHEYGLYETKKDNNKRFVELLRMLENEKIPTVVTYHSVYEKLPKNQAGFVDETLKLASAGIVHEKYQEDNLPNNISFTPKNVYVIPHGSREDIKIDKKKSKEGFGYAKDFIVGSAGLADERKGYLELIDQWPKVVKKHPNAILALELKPHFTLPTRKYIVEVTKKMVNSAVSENIQLTVRDYNAEGFYKRLASFDVLVLPYKSESQSGVLAHGFAVGVPSVVTDIEGLGAEIRNSRSGIAVKDRDKFYVAINKLLDSKKLREKYSKNARDYVKNVNGWKIVAKKTFDVYEDILDKF